MFTDLVEQSKKIFKRLCSHNLICEKDLKYFTCKINIATNLGELRFLPQIHKNLSFVTGRVGIFNSGTPTEKGSEYLGYILKPIMQDSWSYIKCSGEYFKKQK